MNEYTMGTKCVQAGYTPGNGEPRQIPIVQSTTFKYDTSEDMGKLFDLEASGYFYTRLQNPTNDHVAAKIAAMEGGTAAMLTSSGQAANFFALFNICECGSHIVASSSIYGGTFNLIQVTMAKMGITVTFVSPDCTEEELNAAFQDNTRAVFGETIANPALTVLDIEKFAKAAHAHGVPLIVDNTFLSPYFQNPLKLGADVVVHSGTKYLGGHNDTLAGFLVTGREDISEKLRFLIKTTGAGLAPFDSWLILRGIKTLGIRMERAADNALKIAKWLTAQDVVTKVIYPGLPDHPGYEIMKKQARGFGAMLTFQLKDKESALAVLEKVRMIRFAESLGGVETLITYPATQTHADVPQEILEKNGITDATLRLSVGIENVKDLLAELESVFASL